MSFELLTSTKSSHETRLGKLQISGNEHETPLYVGLGSRGVIPHLSPDMLHNYTSVPVLYLAMEDFIDKGAETSILTTFPKQSSSVIKDFTGIPHDRSVILAPRRIPCAQGSVANTDSSIKVAASTGIRALSSDEFNFVISKAAPDALVGLSDMTPKHPVGRRRRQKMCTRTEMWMRSLIESLGGASAVHDRSAEPAVFAPILPIELQDQHDYLELLSGNAQNSIMGLAIYNESSLLGLPTNLSGLCRLCLADTKDPHELLNQISSGFDVLAPLFIQQATDAGICLDFMFPAPKASRASKEALGRDMWSAEHATDMEPLQDKCTCYACRRHNRAYVQHLLNAKEMLAWILLQIHNLQVVDTFFTGIRSSIARGRFQEDRQKFREFYESGLPVKTGLGPRVRGYQFNTADPGHPAAEN